MSSSFLNRFLLPTALCAAFWLAAPFASGATAARQQAQVEILDHAEIPCNNCFFGPTYSYFCFAETAAPNKVFIAYQRTPSLNWIDNSKNYLARVHSKWKQWDAPGQTIDLRYDAKHVWVTRPDGKEVKMIQTYTQDVFTNNDRCRQALKTDSH